MRTTSWKSFRVRASAARRAAADIVQMFAPDRELKRRADDARICGSVDKKVALAAECIRKRMYADAVTLYESCATGIYEVDPHLGLALGEAYLMNGQHDEADRTLRCLRRRYPEYKPNEARLVAARLLEERGNCEAALHELEELVETAVGFESKVRYRLLLLQVGYTRQGDQILGDVIAQAKRPGNLIDRERDWVDIAKANSGAH